LAEAEPSTESLPISEDTTVKPTAHIQQPAIEVPTTEQTVDASQSGIVKIETPTPKKIYRFLKLIKLVIVIVNVLS